MHRMAATSEIRPPLAWDTMESNRADRQRAAQTGNGATFFQDGVGIQDAVAPPYSTLRPLNPIGPGIFPVYQGLEDALLNPTNPVDAGIAHPDHTIAHVLATCAGYAYSDAPTLSTTMARMGLANNRCRMISTVINAMLITSTAFLVQSEDGRVVILVYRGTDPSSVFNLISDLDVQPNKVAIDIGDGGPYPLHAGFYRDLRATRYKITEALLRAKRGFPVTGDLEDGSNEANGNGADGNGPLEPMQALYVTGHSMGAAMASIQSILFRTEPAYLAAFAPALRATYAFAQPLVCGPALSTACDEDEFLRERVIRYVYDKDPAPHFPSRSMGHFTNFGREFSYEHQKWRETTASPATQSPLMVQTLASILASVAKPFPLLRKIPFEYRIEDHAPQNYIVALTPPGVRSEFGDYTYTTQD